MSKSHKTSILRKSTFLGTCASCGDARKSLVKVGGFGPDGFGKLDLCSRCESRVRVARGTK